MRTVLIALGLAVVGCAFGQSCPQLQELELAGDHGTTYFVLEGPEQFREVYRACRRFSAMGPAHFTGVSWLLSAVQPGEVAYRVRTDGHWQEWRSVKTSWDEEAGLGLTCLGQPAEAVEVAVQAPWAIDFLRVGLHERQRQDAAGCAASAPELPLHFWRAAHNGWTLWRLDERGMGEGPVAAFPSLTLAQRPLPNPPGDLLALLIQEEERSVPRLLVLGRATGERYLDTMAGSPLSIGRLEWLDGDRLRVVSSCGTRCARADVLAVGGSRGSVEVPAIVNRVTGMVDGRTADWRSEDTGNADVGATWYTFDPLDHRVYRTRIRALSDAAELELVFSFEPEAWGDPVETARLDFLLFTGDDGTRYAVQEGTLTLSKASVDDEGNRHFVGRVTTTSARVGAVTTPVVAVSGSPVQKAHHLQQSDAVTIEISFDVVATLLPQGPLQ